MTTKKLKRKEILRDVEEEYCDGCGAYLGEKYCTTDAAKQTEEAVRRFQLQYLQDIPTNLIVAELCKREGVTNFYDDYTNFRHHIIVVRE